MDVPLLVFGSCVVLLAAVLAFVGASYQLESTPLTPAPRPGFGVKSVAVAGALVLGVGAAGFGGFLIVGVTVVALRVARL